MTNGTTSRLSGLQLVNPHLATGAAALGRAYERVPAPAPDPLPVAPRGLSVTIAGAGRLWDLASWNAATYGTSLLVLVDGTLVHEWYADDVVATDLMLGASMTKSALAGLVGIAVAGGDLRLEDRVTDLVPELGGTGWSTATVLDVATMTTGVDWIEDHRDPTSLASRLTAAFSAGSERSRELLALVRSRDVPGSRFEYCTADSQVLDWVRERATGVTYVEAVGALWQRLGCTDGAVVGVDTAGVAMAGGALAATARDWARIGLLQVDGAWAGEPVLDPAWVEASSRPPYPHLLPGRLPSTITTHAGFGMHWWPLDDAGRRVTADGSRGQFCYVDRDRRVVVVKTSRWPYEDAWADRQYRDLSYLGLPEIARAATT